MSEGDHSWVLRQALAESAEKRKRALEITKLALVYIADNTLDKWARLKANEALTRIRELENA